MAQRIYLIVGGPLDGKAFRPLDGRTVNGLALMDLTPDHDYNNHNFLYEVVHMPRPAERIMVPLIVLVHGTVPRGELIWRVFMAAMRGYAGQMLHG